MMMRNLVISFLVVQVGLCACHRAPDYPPVLLQADSLVYVEPEEALTLLASVEDSLRNAPTATRKYYQLLTIKAADKAYITHTSDSLIRSLVEYYEQEDDFQLLSEVYYYAGRTYRDLYDAPQALTFFQKSLEASPQESSDRAAVYAQIGEIYFSQSIYDDALQMYGEAYRLDSIAGYVEGQLLDLRDLAFTYRMKQQYTEALQFYLRAEQLANQSGDEALQGLIGMHMAGIYDSLGATERAAQLMEQALGQVGDNDRLSAYDVYANILMNQGKWQEAKAYYEMMAEAHDLNIRLDAYDGLATIAAQHGQSDEYLRYFNLFKLCNDSLQTIAATETVSRINALYNYQLREQENARLKLTNRQRGWIILSLLFVSLVVLSVLFAYYRRRRRELRSRLEHLQRLKEEQYRQSEAYILANKQEIAQLQEQLDAANVHNEELVATLESQKEELELANRLAEIKIEQREKTKKTIQESALMGRLQGYVAKGQHIGKQDVEEMERFLSEICPHFLPYLAQLGEISPLEYEVCLLLKLGISPAAIATLVLREKSTISVIRRRLYKKVTGIEGTPADWDEIILSL